MDSVLEMLLSQLSGDTLDNISDQLGVNKQSAQQAISLALPLLLGNLNRNSATSEGAQALTNALQRDHDGSILDNLVGNLGRQEVIDDGYAILGHVLGDKRGSVGKTIGQASGLDSNTTMQLLSMLAPVVLGALGKMQRKQELDAGGVASLLLQEREQATSKLPGIAQLLDMDADGDITDDMVNLGGSLLSSFLSK
jgi:hypothetical protein